MSKKSQFPSSIDTMHQFRTFLLQSLAKFNNTHTLKTGTEEIRELMMEHITNPDRMNVFLQCLNEENDMKNTQRKEYIKLYALAAEIFEESLIPFIPKILSQISKWLKDASSEIQQAYADSLGSIVHFVVSNL